MFKKVLFLTVILSLASVVSASITIIDDIKINGLVTADEREILSKISYGIGMPYSQYKTREDIKNIYEIGIFDDISVDLIREDGKNVLIYNFTEKPKIANIIIKGNSGVGDGDIKGKFELGEAEIANPFASQDERFERKEKPRIREGGYLDEFVLKQVVEQVKEMYRKKNYYYVEVNSKINEAESGDKGEKRVDVIINVDEGKKVKVKSITAEGNSVFGLDKIKGILDTKEEGWFQSGVFDDDKFIEDMKKLLLAYYAEGYVKATINGYELGEIELNRGEIIEKYVNIKPETNSVEIHIPIQEGIRYSIREIVIEGNTIFNLREIDDVMESKKERVFDKNRFEMDVAGVRNLYSQKGHIFAQVRSSYMYDDDTGAVDIGLTISEGPIAYVNEIKVRGNYSTKDKVILREILVEPGEAFDSEKIRRSQERIYNLGFFDNVIIDTEQIAMDKLNLVFEVLERKTNTIGLGAGYSTVEGLVGYLQLTNANLFGEGKTFSADVQFGNTKRSWQLSYKDPWLFDMPTSFGVDVWNILKEKSYNNQGYDLDTYGLNLSFGRRFTNEIRSFVTYRYQEDKYSNIDEELQGIVAERTSQVSSITPMFVYDTRDDIFDPGRGIYASLALQAGGGLLGGDYNYYKGTADFRYFVPSFWRFVLGFRAKAGNVWGFPWAYGEPDVPPTEKFYCGGTDTVRGYEERALNPLGGGNFTIVTNIEYKLKVVERMFTVVAFYDSGNAWASAEDVDFSNPFLYPSAGMGIRFTIPGTVMLIRLDWGYPLVADPTTGRQQGKIHFNIGNIF
ncbi:MAG TPA: outer membrane protein assembly factor BamA [Firmicutes bacterium]|nr:outer membrane protein assembly factor BamA [Bacillota bacterium]